MFHIPTIGAARAAATMTRVSAARFSVHCFAANAGANSALDRWALAAEGKRLWKSLFARRNAPFTVARRACVITGSNCRGISCSAPRLLVALAKDGFGCSIFDFSQARVAVYSVVACLIKMQLGRTHLHLATTAARWRLSERQLAPRSYGAPPQLSRPGATDVSGFAAPLFSQ